MTDGNAQNHAPQIGELIVYVVLGLTFLASMGATLIFISELPFMIPMCLAPGLGSLAGAVMFWKRQNRDSATLMSAVAAITLLILGMMWAGLGGSLLIPGEDSPPMGLGPTIAFCFAPGGLLSLVGLGAYWVGIRRQKGVIAEAAGETAVSPAAAAGPQHHYLEQAATYRRQILHLLQQSKKDAPLPDQFTSLQNELGRWEERLQRLVERLTRFEQNRIMQQDLERVPAQIARLETQLADEPDPELKAQISETLAKYREQQKQLDALSHLMRRTHLDIEETVAAMGTIYSQLQVMNAMDIDSSRAKRLAHEVEEQVQKLNDLLYAVEEVYDQSPLDL